MGQNQLADVGRGGKEVMYSGRYVVVVEDERFGLVACPREDPTGREGEYLLYMIDELMTIYDKVFKRDKYNTIYVCALVKRSGEWHELVVWRDGDVQLIPWVADYADFIKTADRVEMETVGRGIARFSKARRGRYAVVLEGENGLLHAYARLDVGLGPGGLMLKVIREVMDEFEELKGRAVVVHGIVWRNNVAYFPVIRDDFSADFTLADNDYEYFVRTAEEVKFVWVP